MDRARITEALRTATEIIDEVLPWEPGPRNRSMADRTELRKAALPLLLTALLAETAPAGDNGELITPAQAAAIIGVKASSTVIGWAIQGLLPATRTPDGRWYIRRHDAEEFREASPAHALPRDTPVPITDLITMRDTQGMSWQQISACTGKSRAALYNRYHRWKNSQDSQDDQGSQGARRATVIHLTRPDLLAGNTEIATAHGRGWEIRDVPDDDRDHPRGTPCPACTLDGTPGTGSAQPGQ